MFTHRNAGLRPMLFLLLVATRSLSAQDVQRLPVPDKTAQTKAIEEIKQLFEDEYQSKEPKVRVDLADKLLGFVPTETDVNLKFALLREALELASRNGATETAFSAADQLTKTFELDPQAIKSYTINNLGKSTISPEGAKLVAEACILLANQQLEKALFKKAESTIAQGAYMAKRARSLKLATELRKLQGLAKELKVEFAKAESALAALKANPADATANLTVGRFECFQRGKWEVGIPMLSKCDDVELKELALKSLSDPMEAAEQVGVGHAWWKYGQGLEGKSRDLTLAYAASWYQKAEPELTGITKQLAIKRIKEAGMSTVASASNGSKPAQPTGELPQNRIDLLKLIDLDQDGSPRDRWTMQDGSLVCTKGSFVPKVVVPYQPPAEYDLRYVYSPQKMSRHTIGISLPNPILKTSMALFAGTDRGVVGVSSNDHKYHREIPNYFVANRQYEVLVKVRKKSIQMFLDKKPAVQFETDYGDLQAGSWHRTKAWQQVLIFSGEVATFHAVELIEVSGKGVMTREP